jgi:hypothetical protein
MSSRRLLFAVCLVASSFAPGCASGVYGLVPAPNHADRVRIASEQERRKCDAEPADPRLFSPAIVESTAPLYGHVQAGDGPGARLHGAELRLRPLPGMTAEILTRAFACRSARLVLGRVEAAPSEPYFLPDGSVKIDVRSDDGSFVVAVQGEDVAEDREILARARAFAPDAAK